MIESARSEALIHHLLEGTCYETGHEFFHALVRSAAMALDVAGIWVTEYLPDARTLRSLAFWMNGSFIDGYEYSIAGTPCEKVIENSCLVHYPEPVIELFPGDPDLVKLSAVSYAGVPLLRADGTVLGHLAALDTKPFQLPPDVESAFRIFAARAAAELNRLRAEAEVRDSEQRFSQLFESAMDAIFELDDQFRILRANASAASLFGIAGENLLNRRLTTLLSPASTQKFSTVIQQLDASSQHSAWVPRGFDAVRSDGSHFPAEASVSRFQLAHAHRRILQEGEYEPVGSSQTRKVDVRVIAATNRDLIAEVAAGRFREDLIYRLNVFPIVVPPLRDRGNDVEILAQRFIDRFSARLGKRRPELTADCLRRLRSYHWPGNVRELENVIERAVILARDNALSLRAVLPLNSLRSVRGSKSAPGNRTLRTKRELREQERETLLRALEQANWKVAGPNGAARVLGVPPSTLASRMKALQIQRPVDAKPGVFDSRIGVRDRETNEALLVPEVLVGLLNVEVARS